MRYFSDFDDADIDAAPRRIRLGRCSECWTSGGHAVGCPEATDDDAHDDSDE